jgi:hypothetical protein
MKKSFRFFFAFLAISCFSWAQVPDGIRLLDYKSTLHPILGLAINKPGDKLLVSAYGARFHMLEIGKEAGRSAFSQKERQVWSKYLNNDFRWGAKPLFSPEGNTVLLKPLYDNPNVVKIKPTSLVVLNVKEGSVVLERNDILSADYLNENTLIVSTKDGLEWLDLRSGTITKSVEMPEAEALAVSQDGKYIAISFVPTAAQFAVLQSIQFRKKELKIAKRGKRLLAVYQLADMVPVSVVDDEIDVVFRIKFSNDNKSLVLFTRNFKSRLGINKKDLRQENIYKLLALNLIKVDIESGEIDRDFYYSSYYIHMDYDITEVDKLFAFSSTGMVSGSTYKTINGLEVYDYQVPDKLVYSIKTRFKWFKRLAIPYQFAFVPGHTKCYISSGSDLAEWDYGKLPHHVFNVKGEDDEEVAAAAISQLDSTCNSLKFKEMLVENKIEGMFVYEITVFKKGQVATVFSPTDEVTDVRAHNFLMDYLRATKFEGLKIPKDKRVKFQYIFNVDNSSNP